MKTSVVVVVVVVVLNKYRLVYNSIFFKQDVVNKSTVLNKYRLLYTHQRTCIWYVVIWNQTLCWLQTVIPLLLSNKERSSIKIRMDCGIADKTCVYFGSAA